MHMNQLKDEESGFTLIELLVVILIIGILAAIAVPVFLNQRKKASNIALQSDVKNAGMILGGLEKFSGSLPQDTVTSPGVHLSAMRKSDRNNQVQSAQFANGDDPEWSTFLTNGASATTKVITDQRDGYQSMNYRRITLKTSGPTTTSGQYVGFNLPEVVQDGDVYRVGIAMKHSYDGCRNINIEFISQGAGFAGGISTTTVCFTKDNWQYFEAPGVIKGKNVNRVVMSLYASNAPIGSTFDVTGAVIVKGNKIDKDAALDTNGNDYCVQGYHESDPKNIWSYSNLDGGLRNEKC